MNKKKLLVDDIIAVVLIITLMLLVLGFRLFLLMSLIVYPMASLLIFGFSGIYQGIFSKKLKSISKVLNFILGISYILFAIFMFSLLFTPSRIPIIYIIYFLSIPMILIGIGGFLKGLMIDVYSPSLRILNMIIGVITIILTISAILYIETSFVFHFFSLIIALGLNCILRSELYLSEFGLSLFSAKRGSNTLPPKDTYLECVIKNLKLVFILMDSFEIRNPEIEEY